MKQDAMMQQIFSVINILMNQDENASKSKLKIRTYKVSYLNHFFFLRFYLINNKITYFIMILDCASESEVRNFGMV